MSGVLHDLPAKKANASTPAAQTHFDQLVCM
jgi:hypothetical protein